MLFYVRLASMGAGRAFSILRHEQVLQSRYFGRVERLPVPEGKPKVWICGIGIRPDLGENQPQKPRHARNIPLLDKCK